MDGFSVDLNAYRAAAAARECPYHRPPQVYQALGEISSTEAAKELVAEYKPETFGPLSLAVETMVRGALTDPSALPSVTEEGKDRVRNGYDILEEADVPLATLMYSWAKIMDASAKKTSEGMDGAERNALESLLHIRQVTGISSGTVEGTLAGGGGTAVTTCGLLARSMNEQLKSMGYDKNSRHAILLRSYQPMLDCTKLYFPQLQSLSFANLGGDEAFGGLIPKINFTKARTDLFTLSEKTNRLIFNTAPEYMPGRSTEFAGQVPPTIDEARIGCPIRLSPGLAQRLWVAFINSMHTNDVI